jgi:hypothetical protein
MTKPGSLNIESDMLIVRSTSDQKMAMTVRRIFWAAALVLGLLQAWTSRMTLVDDAVNYLDMGDHIWNGRWSMAINGIWSPLYAAILGVANGLFRPSSRWEYPLVHLILFLVFLFTLWCFDSFLVELVLFRQEDETDGELTTPEWVWLTVGFTLFLWSSLQLIGVKETNPDMLVAASFYLACKLLVRIRRGRARWFTYAGLGLALGCGYLAKSIMFPVSLSCLLVVFIIAREQRQLKQAFIALVGFLLLSVPFVVALSSARGKVTFGETGRYNYAVHVNHLRPLHWQGEVPGSGRPIHGTRQIFDRPAAFEFARPLEATYPAWYDASYWYEGVQTRFNWRDEVKNFARLSILEFSFFLGLNGSLVAGLFILYYMSGRKWLVLRDLSKYWFLLLPSGTALGLYALIYIEPRYLAPFLVVSILSFFIAVRLPASSESLRLWAAIAVLILLMFVSPIEWLAHEIAKELKETYHGVSKADPNAYQKIAEEMLQIGLRPGDRIASLEYSSFNTVQWARLAKVKIVAEIYYWPTLADTSGNNFWNTDPTTQEKVIQAFSQTGARAIVSQEVPPLGAGPNWSKVGNSKYYIYWLNPKEPASSSRIGQVAF